MRLCAGHPTQPSTSCTSRGGPPITQRTWGLGPAVSDVRQPHPVSGTPSERSSGEMTAGSRSTPDVEGPLQTRWPPLRPKVETHDKGDRYQRTQSSPGDIHPASPSYDGVPWPGISHRGLFIIVSCIRLEAEQPQPRAFGSEICSPLLLLSRGSSSA
jgi:hypothetical protein